MTDEHGIQFPDSPADLAQHEPVNVAMFLVSGKAERPVLAGRSLTTYLRPNGAIVQIRPQIKRPWPIKMNDELRVRFSKGAQSEPLFANAQVSWVRERAFMPSGLAVTFVGITFDWDPDEMALEVAAFLGG